jgi:phosphotransferase system HPr-like phosphotransfer protein
MRTIKCTLNCEKGGAACLHLRPAAFIAKLCNVFPRTQFLILRKVANTKSPKGPNAKSIMELQFGYFMHGEEVTVEVDGECEIMASEFFRVAWENLLDFTEDWPASEERLSRLIDETFSRIHDPDVDNLGGGFTVPSPETQIKSDMECRSVAVINDRLHNLSLAIIPQIARQFKCRLQIAFEVPMQGIFAFAMESNSQPGSEQHMLEQILQLPIEVGTRITILSWGSNRFTANAAVRNVLQNLWQCDDWLRKRAAPSESEATILELLEFAQKTSRRPTKISRRLFRIRARTCDFLGRRGEGPAAVASSSNR